MNEPVKGYFRLFPGNEVRLKSTYIVKCTGCKTNENGEVIEVYAEYDPETRGGNTPDGRKVRGTIHWVDAKTAVNAQVNLYNNLFIVPDPENGEKNFIEYVNPDSLEIIKDCKVESNLIDAKAPNSYQFMRLGYFCVDNVQSKPGNLVFNRSVSLKDGFKKKNK